MGLRSRGEGRGKGIEGQERQQKDGRRRRRKKGLASQLKCAIGTQSDGQTHCMHAVAYPG